LGPVPTERSIRLEAECPGGQRGCIVQSGQTRVAPPILPAATILICLATAVSSPAGATLDSRTAANGLKEALGVGTSRSVDLLGRPDAT